MTKIRLKNFSLSLIALIVIFLVDRLTKIYILELAEVESSVDIYVTSYLNLFLIWNKGIAFGLFSMNESIGANHLINDSKIIFKKIILLFLLSEFFESQYKASFLISK